MSKELHIHVRSLEIGDFAFVQNLASKQPNFTVPPAYVLWLMLRVKGSICLIAESSKDGPLAYLVAVPVEGPEKSIFVWQLASQQSPLREKSTLALLTEFRSLLKTLDVRAVMFSSFPNSAAFRAIRRYALRVFSSVPKATNPVAVDVKESEFLLNLGKPTSTAR